MRNYPPTIAEDEAHFRGVPWCASLIRDHKLFVPGARIPKESTEDQFLAVSLSGNQSIDKWLCFADDPYEGFVNRIGSFITLGAGANGWPGVCHGGLLAALIDESMGVLLGVNKELRPQDERQYAVTAYLNVIYKKAVPTPSTIFIEVKVIERHGRKVRLSATTWEDDSLLATAEALFIKMKPML